MARSKGIVGFQNNFEPKINAPFDARMKVPLYSDLTSPAAWSAAVGDVTYKGMIVAVTDDPTPDNNGLWILLGADYTQTASWVKAGTGAGGGGGGAGYSVIIGAAEETDADMINGNFDAADPGYVVTLVRPGQSDVSYVFKSGDSLSIANWSLLGAPLDSDIQTIGNLTPSNDDIIQRKAGAWTNRTPAQLKTDLLLTKSDVGLSNVDNTSDINKPISTATQTALNAKEPTIAAASTNPTRKVLLGDKSWYQIFDTTTGRFLLSLLPDVVLGQLVYGGTLNAATALAALSNNAKTKLGTASASITLTNDNTAITGYVANEGVYYVVTTAGTFAGISFEVGDWCISNGSAWAKVDNSDAVQSVNNQTGAVTVNRSDETITIAVPANTTYAITLYASEVYKVKGFRARTGTGSCDIRMSIGGVAQHTGVTSVNASAPLDGVTGVNWNVAIGDEVIFTVSNVSSDCTMLTITVQTGY